MPDTSTLLSVFGVVVAIFSALYARWSGVAAQQSAAIARTALVSTQRAFVFAPQLDTMNIVDTPNFLLKELQIVPTWKNSGLTPARRLAASVGIYMSGSDEEPQISFDPVPLEAVRCDVAPQTTFQGNVLILTLPDIQKIIERKVRFYIWGACEYNDVFDDTPQHQTMFCFEVDVVVDPLMPVNPQNRETKFLRFRAVTEHNRAN